jgi:(+)-abscisic acid 8'-hydroxylase
MRERRGQARAGTGLLGCLMRSRGDDGAPLLSDEQIADNVIGVLFAAQDTTASALTWIVKYLHDHPKLLEAVRAEQAAVREATGGGRQPLAWAHTKSMALTHRVRACVLGNAKLALYYFFSCGFIRTSPVQVILESLRMASIISFTFREAVADVEYKGTHVRVRAPRRVARGATRVGLLNSDSDYSMYRSPSLAYV